MERYTQQRQAVSDALEHSGQVLSPQQILTWAQADVPSLNLSTVYRQIKALHDKQEIVKVDLPGQPPRFEALCRQACATRDGHHHHYFHCSHCDRAFPLHACPGKMAQLAPPGFEVAGHELTLQGRCADCVAGLAQ